MDDEAELNELCEFFQRLNDNMNGKNQSYNFKQGKHRLWQFSCGNIENSDELDKFLKTTGGRYGGWHEIHHRHFIYLRARHNLSSVVFIFRQNYPEITEQEILEHNKWYTKYLKLKCNQKKITREYKIEKANDQLKIDPRSVTLMKVRTKRDDNVKVEIERWKEWKRKMNEKRKKEEELKAEIQRKRDQTKWLQHLHRKQLMVEQQKKKHEEMQAIEHAKTQKELNERRIRSATANRMLAVFRQKDETWLQQKQTKKELAQQMEQEKLNNVRAVISKLNSKISVDRDPYRLLIPTVEWKQKMRRVNREDTLAEHTIDKQMKIINITNIPHLAIPQWRGRMSRRKSE